jgi:malate dehydrogenase (oxaloacetate-decarboxylating)
MGCAEPKDKQANFADKNDLSSIAKVNKENILGERQGDVTTMPTGEELNEATSGEIVSAGYSLTLRLRIQNRPGGFASVVNFLAEQGASLAEVTLLSSSFEHTVRDVTLLCRSEKHRDIILRSLSTLALVKLLGWQDDTFAIHAGGKLFVQPREKLATRDDLARAYTPGVARICRAIADEPDRVFTHTIKRNAVAVISDGSAVLGLGNIGPSAALPVMEGKAVLFKQFAGVDAYPICLTTQDVDEIVDTVVRISPGFGGINLEDISAPRCFEIENRLSKLLDIPVFHDDQHGTAVVVLAGLYNALKIVGKKLEELKVVLSGFGAGGVAITRILLEVGVKNIIPCDSLGVVYRGRTKGMNAVKEEVIQNTNPDNIKGALSDALRGADVFIGVSQPGTVTAEDVRSMNRDPVVFALANPIPEILPSAIRGIARIIATGRSDYANQINNVLCFPGIFRGALDCFARDITPAMKHAAAKAIADSVLPADLHEEYIIPDSLDVAVTERVAAAVQKAARNDGVARVERFPISSLAGRHNPLEWQQS